MPEYKGTLTIDATPDDLFDFLSRVENLPKYFSRMTEAHPATGDEVHVTATLPPEATGGDGPQEVESDATFSVDAERRSISWGTENEHHYHGELQVTPSADGAEGATVAVTLHTEHESDEIGRGIDETLQNVAELVASSPQLRS
jgi:uncharacterized protein YndB with AHSA1/START domain